MVPKVTAMKKTKRIAQQDIEFLDHVVTNDGIRPDMRKINAIQGWKRPLNQKMPRWFFGLANNYASFIQVSLKLLGLLSDLLKKWLYQEWVHLVTKPLGRWRTSCIYRLYSSSWNFNKLFEVHTEVPDFVIVGVLMKNERLLHMKEKNSKVVIVDDQLVTKNSSLYCIVMMWQHYFTLHKTKIYMDNVFLKYLGT